MKVLLDTHTFIWFSQGSEKLSKRASEIIENKQNQTLLSVASAWEMQIKVSRGKLQLDLPLSELINTQITINNLQILPLELSHKGCSRKLDINPRRNRISTGRTSSITIRTGTSTIG